MIYKNACSGTERLSKNTLLAYLDSKIDSSKAIVKSTGEVIDLVGVSETTINENINNKIWIYFEEIYPKRILLTNPNWYINSFDSFTGNVCVTIFSSSGSRHLNFNLKIN